MNQLPRIAIGTIEPRADLSSMLWALNECLTQHGLNVQNFSAQPCCTSCRAEQDPRHNPVRILDNWLLSERSCQELFYRTTRYADVAIVSGNYEPTSLNMLCQRLDLARIVVLDASRLDSCLLPARPDIVDGILLNHLPHDGNLYYWKTVFEALWGTPVLGALNFPAKTASALTEPAEKSPLPTRDRQRLGRLLGRNLETRKLLQIARRSQLATPANQLFAQRTSNPNIRVAVALDEAFPCHCPDTLDLFESFGATLHEFSPLHSEDLPEDTDLVYISCGQLETMAGKLAENICLKQALQNYTARGGRIYAECDGLAYLCQQVQLPGKENIPMVGLLPTTAQFQPQTVQATRQESHLRHDSWFGRRDTRLRAYWNPRWQLDPCNSVKPIALTEHGTPLLVSHQQVIGNLAHLDFLSHPQYLPRIFVPNRTHLSTLP